MSCKVGRSLFSSCGGKEVFIKGVAQAIPAYAMSCFRLSKMFCAELSRVMARFWGNTDSRKQIHWLSWEKICWPKDLSSLNFRDL